MQRFSASGQERLNELARRHGFSPEAVATMAQALQRGLGRMAQFDHREFGGSGQWMRGGMTMISAMFDAGLKARVDRLCDELAHLLDRDDDLFAAATVPGDPRSSALRATGANWWPEDLGRPNSAGGQNDMRYAYFAQARRLAIDDGGRVTVYDTLDHQIGGVAAAQHGPASRTLTFSGPHGIIDVSLLPVVSDGPAAAAGDGPTDSVGPMA